MGLFASISSKLKRKFNAQSRQHEVYFALPENKADHFIIDKAYSGTVSKRVDRIVEKRQHLISLGVSDFDGGSFNEANPLSTDTIKELEDKMGTDLPEEYKAFLKIVGEGSVGPWCKLTKREQILASDMDYPLNGELIASHPFKYTVAQYLDLFENMDEDAYFSAVDNFWHDKEDGLIRVGNFGCAIFFNLIVNGPERGNLWVRDPNAHSIFPLTLKNKPNSRVGVLDWFENWLDYQINALNRVTS